MDQNVNLVKGIVFDMDGTLVDTESLHIASWKEICLKFGLPFKDEWTHNWVGISDVLISNRIVLEYKLPITGEDFVIQKRAIFQRMSATDLNIFPGVKEGLQRLRDINKSIATMSNGFEANRALTFTGIKNHFLSIVSADDVPNHKPAPDCYIEASRLANIDPKISYAVEDSVSGVNAAKSAGLFTIGVVNSVPKERLKDADLILDNTPQVMEYLCEVFGK